MEIISQDDLELKMEIAHRLAAQRATKHLFGLHSDFGDSFDKGDIHVHVASPGDESEETQAIAEVEDSVEDAILQNDSESEISGSVGYGSDHSQNATYNCEDGQLWVHVPVWVIGRLRQHILLFIVNYQGRSKQ